MGNLSLSELEELTSNPAIWDRAFAVILEHGDTISSVSKAIGYDRSYLSSHRSRGHKPPFKMLIYIAVKYRVSIDYLIYGADQRKMILGEELGKVVERASHDKAFYDLICKLSELPPEKISAIYALIP